MDEHILAGGFSHTDALLYEVSCLQGTRAVIPREGSQGRVQGLGGVLYSFESMELESDRSC